MNIIHFSKAYSKSTGIAIALVGITVLIGWAFDISELKSILPRWVTMKANTAFAFFLSGISLWLSHQSGSSVVKKIQALCAFLIVSIGFLTLCEYFFKVDFGIDQILFKEHNAAAETSFPGRMSPVAAFNFLLLGITLLLLKDPNRKSFNAVQILSFIAGISAFWSILGYLFNAKLYYYFPAFTSVALHTAVLFLFLSAGILLAKPDSGFAALITNDSIGGLIVRGLLPATAVIPTLFAWLVLYGQTVGFFDIQFGATLMVISTIVFFTILIMINAHLIYRIDVKRREIQKTMSQNAKLLFESNTELERFNRLAVGRELKMIELKRIINELYEQKGELPPYHLATSELETGD